MKKLLPILLLLIVSCTIEPVEIMMNSSSSFTNISIENTSDSDSVAVYLTLQEPNSVIGIFGIKESDTIGSKSQGYFYAKKNKTYYSDYESELLGFNISFETPPLSCSQAISNGFPSGVNIIEGSINCAFEVFDISCVDGVNCIISTSVTDTVNWVTGNSTFQEPFKSARNKLSLAENCSIRGVFPYRCTDCIRINPSNIPENCFDLPVNCSSNRFCQVSRTNKAGGVIAIKYSKK